MVKVALASVRRLYQVSVSRIAGIELSAISSPYLVHRIP
jgi:hypothetical protein